MINRIKLLGSTNSGTGLLATIEQVEREIDSIVAAEGPGNTAATAKIGRFVEAFTRDDAPSGQTERTWKELTQLPAEDRRSMLVTRHLIEDVPGLLMDPDFAKMLVTHFALGVLQMNAARHGNGTAARELTANDLKRRHTFAYDLLAKDNMPDI